MGFAQILKLLLEFSPLIFRTVQAVEAAVPGKGQGSKKLGMVLSTVTAAAAAAPAVSDAALGVRDGVRELRAGHVTPEAVALITEGVKVIAGHAVEVFNSTGWGAAGGPGQRPAD
jgi:hypothetical protein